MIITPIF